MGNKSKSRKTRVTVHVFCMSSHGVSHTHKKENYIPHCMHTSYAGGITSYGSCVLHVVSWFNICVKLHESMSSGFKLMEQTQKLLTHNGQ